MKRFLKIIKRGPKEVRGHDAKEVAKNSKEFDDLPRSQVIADFSRNRVR